MAKGLMGLLSDIAHGTGKDRTPLSAPPEWGQRSTPYATKPPQARHVARLPVVPKPTPRPKHAYPRLPSGANAPRPTAKPDIPLPLWGPTPTARPLSDADQTYAGQERYGSGPQTFAGNDRYTPAHHETYAGDDRYGSGPQTFAGNDRYAPHHETYAGDDRYGSGPQTFAGNDRYGSGPQTFAGGDRSPYIGESLVGQDREPPKRDGWDDIYKIGTSNNQFVNPAPPEQGGGGGPGQGLMNMLMQLIGAGK